MKEHASDIQPHIAYKMVHGVIEVLSRYKDGVIVSFSQWSDVCFCFFATIYCAKYLCKLLIYFVT